MPIRSTTHQSSGKTLHTTIGSRSLAGHGLARFLAPLLIVAMPLIASLLLPAAAHAQFTAPLQEKDLLQAAPGIVVSVQFQGNQQLSADELTTVVTTRVPGWFARTIYHIPWLGPAVGSTYDTLDYAKLQSDTARLNQYYKDHGFLLAKSTFEVRANQADITAYQDWLRRRAAYRVQPTNDRGPLLHDTVIYHIVEGPPFTIGHVTFTGLESLPEEFQPELTEHILVESGARWNYPSAGAEANRIDSIMVENGYPYFNRDSIVILNTLGTTTVNVQYYYRPGPRLKFGRVEIVYDTNSQEKLRVDPKVIRAQLLTDSGRWYQQSLVQRSEANLTHLNAFNFVRIELDTTNFPPDLDSIPDGTAIPVKVTLRLNLRAEVSPGVYAGTSTQGVVFGGTANYFNRNLSGKADNINASAAYQVLPTTQKRESANSDYTLPYIGLGRIPLTFGLGASYEEQKQVPDTTVLQYFVSTYSTHIASNIILSQLDDRTFIAPDIAYQITHSEARSTPLYTDSIIRRILPVNQYSLIPGVTYQDDRTNDVFNPTTGHFFNAIVDGGIPISDKYSYYVRAVPMYKHYVDFSDKGTSVLAARVRVGKSFIFSDNPAAVPPPERRFYGGGGTSIRGWPDRTLLVSSDSAANPEFGGYNVLEANVEWRYAPFQYDHEFTSWQKLTSPIRVVLFMDAGNVWDNSVDIFAKPKLALTGGIGIRYNLFFGPIRFDWGLKLFDPSGRFTHTGYTVVHPGDNGAWIWQHVFANPDVMTFQFGIGQAF